MIYFPTMEYNKGKSVITNQEITLTGALKSGGEY